MTLLATLIWLLNVMTTCLGHLFLKKGVTSVDESSFFQNWKKVIKNKWIWIGSGLFVFEFFTWLIFLSLVPLSVAVLLTSSDTILLILAGAFFFDEKLTWTRLFAAFCITLGVILVGWG